MTDRHIMIQSVNDQCDVFTHITADIVWFCQEFRSLMNKVGSKKLIKEFRFLPHHQISPKSTVKNPKVEQM